jgi:hypothetical protein
MELWLSSPGLVSGDGDGFQGAQADSDSKSSQKSEIALLLLGAGLSKQMRSAKQMRREDEGRWKIGKARAGRR